MTVPRGRGFLLERMEIVHKEYIGMKLLTTKKIRRFLIKWLFNLLDDDDGVELGEKELKMLNAWMLASWQDQGFHVYIKARRRMLRKRLSDGIGWVEPPRDDYVRIFGQHFELLRLAERLQRRYEAWYKDRVKKEDARDLEE